MWDWMYNGTFNIESAGNTKWIRIEKSGFTTQLLFALQIVGRGTTNEISADLFFGPNISSYSSLKIPTSWSNDFYYTFNIDIYPTYYEIYIDWSNGGPSETVDIYFMCLGWG